MALAWRWRCEKLAEVEPMLSERRRELDKLEGKLTKLEAERAKAQGKHDKAYQRYQGAAARVRRPQDAQGGSAGRAFSEASREASKAQREYKHATERIRRLKVDLEILGESHRQLSAIRKPALEALEPLGIG